MTSCAFYTAVKLGLEQLRRFESFFIHNISSLEVLEQTPAITSKSDPPNVKRGLPSFQIYFNSSNTPQFLLTPLGIEGGGGDLSLQNRGSSRESTGVHLFYVI